MKLYSYDGGWRGGVVCIANSREEAIKKFKNCGEYCVLFEFEERFVEEHDIEEVVEVGGDY